ncbi:TPA: hypothetical protein QDZ95_003043 [Shewanella algae]|uniref:hypothetical protein n=1 Tax=Shewanella algae TaxID=38313 RepID=UPI001C564536|nr:hypothetical protein [Shewanella algae]HDS1199519.1 hypothetical protein [Shewanella algae]
MLILRQEHNALYHRFRLDIGCTNEVIEFLLGGDIKTTPFSKSFGFISGWLIKSGYDKYKNTDLEPLITYWERLSGEVPDDNRKQGELANLVHIARKKDMWRDYSDVRETAFNRIELVCQIDISD